eukprot:1168792-Amphidinium_carterae.2
MPDKIARGLWSCSVFEGCATRLKERLVGSSFTALGLLGRERVYLLPVQCVTQQTISNTFSRLLTQLCGQPRKQQHRKCQHVDMM